MDFSPARKRCAVRRNQLPSEKEDMKSSSDIILLVTSDGKEWGKYIADRLNAFPQVSHTTVDLHLNNPPRDSPSELKSACQQSAVVLLLATEGLLSYMQKKAGRFAPTLKELPSTTTVVVLLLLDRKDLLDVTQKYGYVTSEWKHKDVGNTPAEVQKRIAEVLDIVEQNRQAPRGRTTSSSRVASKSLVEFFPSTVYEKDTKVAMVFKEDVRGEVTVKLDQTDTALTTTRETATVFTFNAPQKPSGKYSVLVFVDSKRQRRRPELTYMGTDTAALTSPRYLAQALRLSSEEELDLHLKDLFNDSLPADRALERLFRHLPDPTERQKNAGTKYPTLLHYAAAFGLSEFCAALLDCPGSYRAFCIRNCDGLDPAELAAENGHDELEDYILDLMEIQAAANDERTGYMTMNPFLTVQDSSPGHRYMFSRTNHLHTQWADSEDGYDSYKTMDRCTGDSEDPPEDTIYSSPLYPYDPTTSQQPLTPKSEPRPALPPRPENLPSPSTPSPSSLPRTVASDVPMGVSSSALASRPPVPPPRSRRRTRSTRLPESPYVDASKDRGKACTLPPGGRLDPTAFMGMDDTEPSATEQDQDLPAGAVGSRSQSELIEVQELVKSQEINLHEAQMLFHSWQQRFNRNTSVSFKDRQKGLLKMKSEFQQRSLEQEKRNPGSPEHRGLLSRFLFGGRQRKAPSVKLNISEPVLSPTAKKTPIRYVRVSSDSQIPVKATDRDSAISVTSSSRSSAGSQQGRLSNASLPGEAEAEMELDDEVFRRQEANVSRRDNQTARMNRLSLGGLFLEQALGETERSGNPPPPLPYRDRPHQPTPKTSSGDSSDSAESTNTISEGSRF